MAASEARNVYSLIAKRLVDIVVATLALTVLALPMAAVAMLVRLHDGGPSFYRQLRVGRGGQTFRMLKFRSMVVNADALGGYATSLGDERITPVGRFIRRTSLDELPQLLNVLWGDMSIVGPRPDVPAQKSMYTEEQWRTRHLVRPGITGLAQAIARSHASPAARTKLDLAYVRDVSLWLDFKIVLMTVRQLMTKSSN